MTAPTPCAAVSALCDLLPEVRGMLSLVASHPAVPADLRGRCIALHYRLADALGVEAEAVR